MTEPAATRRAEPRPGPALRGATVLRLVLLVAGWGTVTSRATAADEPVTVRLASGRSFTAAIDGRSDGATLWLRFSGEHSTIFRPIAWSAVTGGTSGGQPLSVDELKMRAATARAGVDALPKPRALVTRSGSAASAPLPGEPAVAKAAAIQAWNVPSSSAVTAANYYAAGMRVTGIAIDAQLAGWDADVEADGLVVSVTPIGRDGASLPVDGTVEIELIGPALPPLSRGNDFPVLGRWTRQLRADDLAAVGGTYRLQLPFQAYNPEYEFNPPRHGLVHVRLVAPGHGVFEASADAVTMRGFTPVRERMEQAFGTRFLPTERTYYGKPQVNMGR